MFAILYYVNFKILIMKKLLYVFLIVPLLFSCKDDEEAPPDFRLEAVGEYTYSGTSVSAMGSFTGTGTLTVETLGSTGLKLIFDKGSSSSFTLNASGTAQASNGVAFNVSNTSSVDGEGDTFAIRGVTSFNQAGVDYHAFYDSGRKQIEIALETDYVNNDFDEYNSSIKFLATKK